MNLASAPSAQAARSYNEIPRAGWGHVLRALLSSDGNRTDMLSAQQRLYAEHGPVIRQDLGLVSMLLLLGPDANRQVLLDRERIFSAKKPWNQIMGRIFPRGLLLRDGDEHKHHRKVMLEAFKRPALRGYGERMNPMIEQGIADWGTQKQPFPAFLAFKELTLRIATAIFLGIPPSAETRKMQRAFEDMVAASMSRIRLRIPGLEFYRGLVGREFMIDFFGRLLPEKRAVESSDMLSRLCHAVSEDGDRFDDAEIIDHMIFLMMAAHDTTTSTLTSMLYELAKNPQWQERLREESLAFAEPHVGFEDLDHLESLTWAMRETMRRYPPLPVIPRVAQADFTFAGYVIPKGTMVVVSPIFTHHMDAWWSDPLRFDPERFSPARAEDQRHTHSWVPFGGGPHLCLGMRFAQVQVRAVMHQLLRRYRWSVPAGYTMPVQQAPISKPKDGLPVTMVPLT